MNFRPRKMTIAALLQPTLFYDQSHTKSLVGFGFPIEKSKLKHGMITTRCYRNKSLI